MGISGDDIKLFGGWQGAVDIKTLPIQIIVRLQRIDYKFFDSFWELVEKCTFKYVAWFKKGLIYCA